MTRKSFLYGLYAFVFFVVCFRSCLVALCTRAVCAKVEKQFTEEGRTVTVVDVWARSVHVYRHVVCAMTKEEYIYNVKLRT